jgi:hypothetical protein
MMTNDVWKELIFESAEAQAVNSWMSMVHPNVGLLAGQLFPSSGLTKMQMRVRSDHDSGRVVGVEVIIGMGCVPKETE